MALVWQQCSGGNHYEVRSAGRTRRLYTNGVCHSDYHPDRAVTRSIWDCLFLPLLFKPAAEIRRVLLLGVGGGSVIHLIQQHLPAAQVTGVELSGMHLQVAENFFDLRDVDLFEAEAGCWLQGYAGEPFDAIIDDLFLEEGSEARRAIDANAEWFRLLLSHLAPYGVITMNLPDYSSLRCSGWSTRKTLRRRLPAAFALRTPLLNNVVGAFLRFESGSRRLNQQIKQIPALARAQKLSQLRYSMRRLKLSD